MSGKREIEELTEEEWNKMCGISNFSVCEETFKERFNEPVTEWLTEREKEILGVILGRCEMPIWNGKSCSEIIQERNFWEKNIKESKKRNNGGIDKNLAIQILKWGGTPLPNSLHKIENEEFIQLTKTVLELADHKKYSEAAYTLMKRLYRSGGIAGATKLIGLSDQDSLCIYDSRVGHYLSDLKIGCRKLVLHPPGRQYCSKSDSTTQKSWAKNYERLIWILDVARNYLTGRITEKEEYKKLRIADIELAFFALGKCPSG